MHPVLRIVRIVAGWVLVIVGLIGVVLPLVPAVLLVPIGIVLVGRDAFLIRWSRVQMKLWLRDAEIRPGLIGRFGRWAARNERRFSKVLRERRLRDLRPQPSGS